MMRVESAENIYSSNHNLYSDWVSCLENIVLQNPLIASRPSLLSLKRSQLHSSPNAVFLGIGLCSKTQLSLGLPIDVLGMLLSAEEIRRRLQIPSLLVLIADSHARINHFDPWQIGKLSQRWSEVLGLIKDAFSLSHMKIIRASTFHNSKEYMEIFSKLSARIASSELDYFIEEISDMVYFNRNLGNMIKVGWTISSSGKSLSNFDEMAFDDCFRKWIGNHLGFVYCKAGRVLDVQHHKASPYIVSDPRRRICLTTNEPIYQKLHWAEKNMSNSIVRGVRKHLKNIARSFSSLIDPLDGILEVRLHSILSKIFFNKQKLVI